MAITFRIYRSGRIGIGTRDDPWRSALTSHITADGTQDFVDWINDAHAVRYAFAWCEPYVHAAMEVDMLIQPISPEFANMIEMQTWLDATHDFTSVQLSKFESDGVPADWMAGVTRRQIFRYISKAHLLAQQVRRGKDADLAAFFSRSLNVKISQIPASQRSKLRWWAQTNQLKLTFDPNTTVRQVVHQAIEILYPQSMSLGPLVL